MGLGISRWNMTSCGAFRRSNSDLEDPSTYTRLMVDRDNHDDASAVVDSRNTSQGQMNNSSLPNKDVVNEEKNAHVNNIYRQLDEESEKTTGYDGPIFMKSPSFRDFMRPVERLEDSVKNNGKKEAEMRGTNKAKAPNYVCTEEACTRVEKKNENAGVNKEAGHGKEKKIYKVFSQYYKPSNVSGGVKNLFHHHPKHPKPSN